MKWVDVLLSISIGIAFVLSMLISLVTVGLWGALLLLIVFVFALLKSKFARAIFSGVLFTLIGIVLGAIFVMRNWSPLLWNPPHDDMSFSHIADPGKRAFFRTLYETYESKTPRSELLDSATSQYPGDADLRLHREWFDKLLTQVPAKGCPIRQVTVPTRWQDIEAVDRVFQVFDIEQCH
jgi:hypothetical protein